MLEDFPKFQIKSPLEIKNAQYSVNEKYPTEWNFKGHKSETEGPDLWPTFIWTPNGNSNFMVLESN